MGALGRRSTKGIHFTIPDLKKHSHGVNLPILKAPRAAGFRTLWKLSALELMLEVKSITQHMLLAVRAA